MEPKAKYPLPNNIIIDKPTSLNNIIGAQQQQTEIQVLAPKNAACKTCVTLQEVPVEIELYRPPKV
jgi:hypothetical protein